jgi:DNA polymerase III delta subunit
MQRRKRGWIIMRRNILQDEPPVKVLKTLGLGSG